MVFDIVLVSTCVFLASVPKNSSRLQLWQKSPFVPLLAPPLWMFQVFPSPFPFPLIYSSTLSPPFTRGYSYTLAPTTSVIFTYTVIIISFSDILSLWPNHLRVLYLNPSSTTVVFYLLSLPSSSSVFFTPLEFLV